jgi:hypothetical protein
MMFEAATLAIMATLHLSGLRSGGSELFSAAHAGVAEAIIGPVLVAGAAAVFRGRANARVIALVAAVFAVAGFIVGLGFTLQGGGEIDIAYHVVVLPMLVLTVFGLAAPPTPPGATVHGSEPDGTRAAGGR